MTKFTPPLMADKAVQDQAGALTHSQRPWVVLLQSSGGDADTLHADGLESTDGFSDWAQPADGADGRLLFNQDFNNTAEWFELLMLFEADDQTAKIQLWGFPPLIKREFTDAIAATLHTPANCNASWALGHGIPLAQREASGQDTFDMEAAGTNPYRRPWMASISGSRIYPNTSGTKWYLSQQLFVRAEGIWCAMATLYEGHATNNSVLIGRSTHGALI